MSGICGWLQTGSGETPALTRNSIGEALSRFDGSTVREASSGRGSIVIAGSDGDLAVDGARICALWGKPRLDEVELASVARERGPARALMEGYARKGSAALEKVRGHFAVAILDCDAHTAFLALDRMGTRPLYYAAERGTFAFASSLDAIGFLPGMDASVRPQAIYDYVHFHVVPGPRATR
jgi:asparagine synthase (glutamine-hydrolysing)